MKDTWRDAEGFGRPTEVSPGTFSVKGPDEDDHSIHCEFITKLGILPCSCDATRKERSWWWKCWVRWQYARVMRHHSIAPQDRVPWPIQGPDGDPWVPGIDFNNDPAGEIP